MSERPIYVGEFGMTFVFTIREHAGGFDVPSVTGLTAKDISAQTGLSVDFVSPTGTVYTYTDLTSPAVSLVTDGTDGKIQFTQTASIFFAVGVWKRQASATLGTTKPTITSGPIVTFEVSTGLS